MTREFAPLGLILLFPTIGVIFNLFFGRRAGRAAVNGIGTVAVALAFVVSAWSTAIILAMPPRSVLTFTLWKWIAAGAFHVDIALRFDALTAIMTLVVSGVGALIHLYSTGYMADDADYARYFAYMNLFTFSMLVLVTAENLVLMFVGWEGVGLCSYLLIAFWYDNPDYAYNGRKAFIVNRVGDAGFLLGIFTLVAALSSGGIWTLSFPAMRAHTNLLQPVATAACLLLFFGATGKSAQIPLYVWLPDAMVGPTPVSALIHAATMVTAGVYMIARLNFLYVLSPDAMLIVLAVGMATAFFAATIAIVQTDIKRVLAYSTISQIGYMMAGVGAGAFAAGIFHLMTHAFFKALLFLCAGSVIHTLHGEQDMTRMGGLRRALPTTWFTMLAATLAISGIPPFSGFFSKDLVLESAYTSGHLGIWIIGVITAGLTSFYMFRLIFLTFYGDPRATPKQFGHAHDPGTSMTLPLIVLAVLSFAGGWVGLPQGFLWGDAFERFLAPVMAPPTVGAYAIPIGHGAPAFLLSAVTTGVSIIGIILAWLFYLKMPGLHLLVAEHVRFLYALLVRKYYIDELYNLLISRPLFWASVNIFHRGVDAMIIDGIVDGTGISMEGSGEGLRQSESGNLQHYAFFYLAGAIAIAAYYVYRVMR
jgi:NADH-quinone oxidoreductase subunit L